MKNEKVVELPDSTGKIAKTGIWEMDLDSRQMIWSSEVCEMLELPLGTTLDIRESEKFYHPDHRSEVAQVVQESIIKGLPYESEIKLLTANGKELWVKIVGLPVHKEGKTVAVRGFFKDIHQDKVREKKLREDQKLIDLAIEDSGVGIWSWDIKNQTYTCNDNMLHLFGWDKATYKGSMEAFTECVHPEDRPKVQEAIESAVSNIEKYDIDYRIILPDNRIRYISSKADTYLDEEGREIHMTGICTDVTALRINNEREAALRSRLMMFIKHTPAAVAMFDNDLYYIAASDRWYEDYNLQGQDIIGKHHYDVFPEICDLPEWLEEHRSVLKGKSIRQRESLFVRKNGEEQWLRYELYPWYHADQTIGGIGMFTENITRYKQKEAELKDSEEKFRTVIDKSSIGLALVDLDGNLFQVNESLSNMIGYSRSVLLNKDISFFTSSGHSEESNRLLQDILEKKTEISRMEKKYQKSSGGLIWCYLHIVLVKNIKDNPRFLILQLQDITENKYFEEHIKRLNISLGHKVNERTLELNATNKELEAFSYSVSHDLRSPLRAIQGFSKALNEDYGHQLEDTAMGYIERIEKGALRMGQLIDDLLSLSKINRREVVRRQVDLSTIVKAITNELNLQYRQHFHLDIHPEVVADCDDRLVRIALENLLNNAYKFSSKTEAPCISFGTTYRKGKTMLFVKDNGAGFDMNFYSNLFIAFQRLHKNKDFSGTGIGLTIVQRVITKHGGIIEAESTPNEGSIFFFTLE